MSSTPETPYVRAARFAGEESAGSTYFQLQEVIANVAGDVDVSVYRFIRNDIWFVAVVGDRPPGQVCQEIDEALAGGESVRLERITALCLSLHRTSVKFESR